MEGGVYPSPTRLASAEISLNLMKHFVSVLCALLFFFSFHPITFDILSFLSFLSIYW